jgi:hypothetical protein
MSCGTIRVAEPRLAPPSKIPRRESGSAAAPRLLSVKHSILSLYVSFCKFNQIQLMSDEFVCNFTYD